MRRAIIVLMTGWLLIAAMYVYAQEPTPKAWVRVIEPSPGAGRHGIQILVQISDGRSVTTHPLTVRQGFMLYMNLRRIFDGTTGVVSDGEVIFLDRYPAPPDTVK